MMSRGKWIGSAVMPCREWTSTGAAGSRHPAGLVEVPKRQRSAPPSKRDPGDG